MQSTTNTPRLSWAIEIAGMSAGSMFDTLKIDQSQPEARDQLLRAIDRCKRFVDQIVEQRERGIALVLWGATGAGKSHLLSAISFALSKTQISAVHDTIRLIEFTPDTSLYIDYIKACYTARDKGQIEDADQYVKQRLEAHDLIIVDDLGAERVKADDWAESEYRKLIELCYTRRALCIATNLTPVQVKDVIGARAYSRLIEMTSGKEGWINLSKLPDRRLINEGILQ